MMGRGTENDILTYIYSTPHGDYNTKMKNLSDKKKARIYEWEKEGVRFRVIIGKRKGKKGEIEKVITFYSNRRALRQ